MSAPDLDAPLESLPIESLEMEADFALVAPPLLSYLSHQHFCKIQKYCVAQRVHSDGSSQGLALELLVLLVFYS